MTRIQTKNLVCVQFRVLLALLQVIGMIYNAIVNLFKSGARSKCVPHTENPILRQSASEIAREIRRRQIRCVAVVSAFIERQREVNPIINAIVAERYEDALREAHEVDDFLASTTLSEVELARSKPLLGVPVSVKESIGVKGMNQAVGSRERLGVIAGEHGACTQKLIDAGAIPLCITTTPEFCLSTETSNLVTGRTNNPFNVRYTAGGSSGGEGALISAGGSVIGIGSDIAGSIRLPAAFCGIFGHKPSTGVTDLRGHVPYLDDPIFLKHLTIGPLCRYAEDLALVTDIISNKTSSLCLDESVKLNSLKIHYMIDSGNCFGSMSVNDTLKHKILEAVEHFRSFWHCEISDVKFTDAQYIAEANFALFFSLEDKTRPRVNPMWQMLKLLAGRCDYPLTSLVYFCMKHDKLLMPSDVGKSKEFAEMFAKTMNTELADNGVFLYPTFPTSAFQHGSSLFTISGLSYVALASILGLPATTVPVGFVENGMPIGIQVIAARNKDRLCLAVARELEKVFGGWKAPY